MILLWTLRANDCNISVLVAQIGKSSSMLLQISRNVAKWIFTCRKLVRIQAKTGWHMSKLAKLANSGKICEIKFWPDASCGRPGGRGLHRPPAAARRPRQRASVGKISAKCCSFSAVSAPIFAKKYAFCSIFKIYQILKLKFLKFERILQILRH